MNAPDVLRMHIAAIEVKHPLKILGLLPRGSIGHVFDDNALEFLAEKRPGLDLLGLAGAEVDLGGRLGRQVGIVLVSGLKGREAEDFPRLVEPLSPDGCQNDRVWDKSVPLDHAMNAPIINRSALLLHIRAIEDKYPLTIAGFLPRGAAAHVFEDDAVDFLADKKPGLSLLDLASAEIDLGDRLGRPVGIVLRSGLKGAEAQEIPALVKPL